MAQKRGLYPEMALLADESIVPELVAALNFDERIALRKILLDPVFRKAWTNIKASSPGVFPNQDLSGPNGAIITNNRFHEMRGWEMFRVALVKQSMEPEIRRPKATETYPDSGMGIVPDVASHVAPLPLFSANQNPKSK